VLGTAIFQARLGETGMAFLDSVTQSVYAYTVPASSGILRYIDQPPNSITGMVARTFLHLTQYVTHGSFEYSILLTEYGPHTPHSWGAAMFFPYYKFVAFLSGIRTADDFTTDLFVRSGAFTTFLGPLWVDFGWWGPILMLPFGLGISALWRRARSGDHAAVPMYLFLAIVLFAAPVANLIQGAMGVYILNAFLFCFFASRLLAPRVTPQLSAPAT
jgi:hypothetical protein